MAGSTCQCYKPFPYHDLFQTVHCLPNLRVFNFQFKVTILTVFVNCHCSNEFVSLDCVSIKIWPTGRSQESMTIKRVVI